MKRNSRERWGQVLREQAESGLSIAEYCRRKQLVQNSFYLWRRKLAGEPTAGHGFVPLAVVGTATVAIELPCGVTIRVPSDDGSLRRVLKVLLEVGAEPR